MASGTRRRCILNPVSGSGNHAGRARRLLEERGFEVVETTGAEDAVRLAVEAGLDGVEEVAVCGGDGTVNEVLRGLAAAEALEEVTFSVIPAGTANLLAGNVGVTDLEHGVEVADGGRVRTVDIGMADEQPFVVSCIAGLPADVSVSTPDELKGQLGTLAFIVQALREAGEFDGLHARIETRGEGEDRIWEGEALCVLVGNARKFVERGGQADMEDGLFDVAIVERMPPQNLLAEGISHRLLGRSTEGVTHMRTREVRVTGADGPLTFSRDGEVADHRELLLFNKPRALNLRVGDAYVVDPDGDGSGDRTGMGFWTGPGADSDVGSADGDGDGNEEGNGDETGTGTGTGNGT
jgi:YegS/Rv2252/BmrU family lipid kinase